MSATKSRNISHRRQLAVRCLLEARTIKEAAENANLSEATLHRYLNDPAFMKEYNEVRNQTVKSMTNRLSSASHKAISKLLSIIESSRHEGNVIRACEIIITASMKGNEINRLVELEERLSEMENKPYAV